MTRLDIAAFAVVLTLGGLFGAWVGRHLELPVLERYEWDHGTAATAYVQPAGFADFQET